jgi:MFS family permease
MLASGGLAVVLVTYLDQLGLDAPTIGLVLTLTLVGDTLLSLWLTTQADRIGRRRVLRVGAVLMLLGSIVFSATDVVIVLLLMAVVAVLSPSGREVGPFLPVEQAALTQLVPDARRTSSFAWYNLTGSIAVAVGALLAGVTVQVLRDRGVDPLWADRSIVIAYGTAGVALLAVFAGLSPAVEVDHEHRPAADAGRFGLHRSRGIVYRLSALFALDGFAGGFVFDSLLAFWFATAWGLEPAIIGAILFASHALAAVSALAAARIAARIGLINTMVATHLPSNVLLILMPFMPAAWLAVLLLFARSTISQMDVPTRQSYTMAVVAPDERSAAAGVTAFARSSGAALAPLVAAPLLAVPGLAAVPFVISGGLKIVYDLSLWAAFRSRPAPEELARRAGSASADPS